MVVLKVRPFSISLLACQFRTHRQKWYQKGDVAVRTEIKKTQELFEF